MLLLSLLLLAKNIVKCKRFTPSKDYDNSVYVDDNGNADDAGHNIFDALNTYAVVVFIF